MQGNKTRQPRRFAYGQRVMKILAAHPLPDFRLRLSFSDGIDAVVDVSDIAGRGVFDAWLQSGVFEEVSVTDYGALSWPGDLDLCPDALYIRATGKKPEDIYPALKHAVAHA